MEPMRAGHCLFVIFIDIPTSKGLIKNLFEWMEANTQREKICSLLTDNYRIGPHEVYNIYPVWEAPTICDHVPAEVTTQSPRAKSRHRHTALQPNTMTAPLASPSPHAAEARLRQDEEHGPQVRRDEKRPAEARAEGEACLHKVAQDRGAAINEGPLKAAVAKGLPTVGTVIDVQWDDRDQWFRGTVMSREGNQKKHEKFSITYEDGDECKHDLTLFTWRVAPVGGRSGLLCRWRLPGHMRPLHAFKSPTSARANSQPARRPARGISKQTHALHAQKMAPLKQTRAAGKRARTLNEATPRPSIPRKQEGPESARKNGTGTVAFLGECIEADDEMSDTGSCESRLRHRVRKDVGQKDGRESCEPKRSPAGRVVCKSEDRTIPPSSASSSVSHSSCAPGIVNVSHPNDADHLSDSQRPNRIARDDAHLPCRKRSWRLRDFSVGV